jgi:hypothetical protein
MMSSEAPSVVHAQIVGSGGGWCGKAIAWGTLSVWLQTAHSNVCKSTPRAACCCAGALYGILLSSSTFRAIVAGTGGL